MGTLSVAPYTRRKPQVGDVAACVESHGNRLVVHRIIQQQRNQYVIQGDNLPIADGSYEPEHLLGCVTKIEQGGRLANFAIGPGKHLIAWMIRSGFYHRVAKPFYQKVSRGKK
jgi:hypothetical protein